MAELIQLSFRAGIDEGTDPKQLPPGTLKVGKNCRQDKNGRIRKRLGVVGLVLTTNTTNLASGARLLPRGDALAMSDGTDAVPYAEALSTWQRIDRVPNLVSVARPLADAAGTVTQATMAASGDLLVQVYSTGLTTLGAAPSNGVIYIQVEDSARNQRVMAPTQVDSSANTPRVFVDGSTAYVIYLTSAGDLKRKALNLTTFALGAASTLKAGVTKWDGVMVSSVLYLVCTTAAGLFVERWSLSTPTQLHTINPVGAATYEAVGIDATAAEYVRVVYSTTAPTTRILTRNAADLTAVAGPTQVSAVTSYMVAITRADATYLAVAYTAVNATTLSVYTTASTHNQTTHAAAPGSAEVTHHLALSSRIFSLSSRFYFLGSVAVIPPAIATSNSTEVSPQSAVVVEMRPNNTLSTSSPHRRVATLESRTSYLQWYAQTQPAADSSGRIHIACGRKQREPVGTEAVPLSAHTHRLAATSEDWGRPLIIGQSILCPGGSPFLFDGIATHPYGFVHEPDILATSVAGGGSMAAGDYVYACVFEWRDANGVLHRSAPCTPVRVTGVGANGTVTLRIATTGIDCKQTNATGFGATGRGPVRIAIYRSTVGGSVLYRLTHEPSYNVVWNDPTVGYVDFTDTHSDSSIASSSPTVALSTRPQLYTDSELEEVNPGAAVTGTIHRGRAWLLSADRRMLQASKEFEEDPELAPGFNEALTLLFDRDKYALASLDEKLIAFDEDGLDVVLNDGPDSNGNRNDWQIVRVQSDVGTTSPKSVATTPIGTVFLSTRGFELLQRDLTVRYIGAPVEDTLASYPVVTSAVVVPAATEVRWTCNTTNGNAGVVVVWDYSRNAWYTREYLQIFSFIDAALIDGVYTLLRSTGKVYRETTANCLDDGIYVEMRASVPVTPSGAAGWHRLKSVQVVGESKSNHKLTIEISRDFAAAAEQTNSFEPNTGVTSVGPLEQCRVTLKHQKRQAAVVTIYDAAPTDTGTYPVGTGEGPILEVLGLYVGRKEGPAKLAAAKRG